MTNDELLKAFLDAETELHDAAILRTFGSQDNIKADKALIVAAKNFARAKTAWFNFQKPTQLKEGN